MPNLCPGLSPYRPLKPYQWAAHAFGCGCRQIINSRPPPVLAPTRPLRRAPLLREKHKRLPFKTTSAASTCDAYAEGMEIVACVIQECIRDIIPDRGLAEQGWVGRSLAGGLACTWPGARCRSCRCWWGPGGRSGGGLARAPWGTTRGACAGPASSRTRCSDMGHRQAFTGEQTPTKCPIQLQGPGSQ